MAAITIQNPNFKMFGFQMVFIWFGVLDGGAPYCIDFQVLLMWLQAVKHPTSHLFREGWVYCYKVKNEITSTKGTLTYGDSSVWQTTLKFVLSVGSKKDSSGKKNELRQTKIL